MTVETEMLEAIRDSAAAIAPRNAPLARIRALRFTTPGWDPAIYRQMGDLGWIGLRIPETQGGSGLGLLEQGALLEELGRALVPEPLIAGSLAAAALAAANDKTLLPALLAGETFIPLAWQETPDAIEAPSTPGPRCFVPASSPGAGEGRVLLPLEGTLLEATLPTPPIPTQDGGQIRHGTPNPTNAHPLGPCPNLAPLLEDAAIATSFYLLGVAEAAFALTLDYLRTREQFGQKLGTFQALQHKAADLKIALTLTRATTEAAATTLDAGAEGATRTNAVARAKTRAAETALLVTRTAIQLHGAIGYTDEHDIGLYLRKAMTLANQHGSPRSWRTRFTSAE